MKKLPKKIKDDAMVLYKTGLSQKVVGKLLGIGGKTVQRWTAAAGISRPINKHLGGVRKRAIGLYQDGEQVKDIATKLGVSKRIFYEWTKGTGIVTRGERRRGKYNPMWKGGITPINAHIRNSIEMKQWRLAVFTRDSFTCISCRHVGGYLEAHHILSFAKHKDQRFNIDNGATLCLDCHWEVHGRKKRKAVS